MKILLVVLIASVLLGLGYMNQDRIAYTDRAGASYQAQVAHEHEIAASVRRVLEQPVSCEFNLRGLIFDPVQVSAGETVPVPSISVSNGVIARPGLVQRGLRTVRIELTNSAFSDLGPGPAGMHRYLATLRLENEKLAMDAPGGRQLIAEIPVNVCIRTSDNEVLSCDPCPAAVPPPAADCAPGAPFRCHWHPCTLTTGSGPTLQCVAWTSDILCVASCVDCNNFPTVPGEFVRRCMREPL